MAVVLTAGALAGCAEDAQSDPSGSGTPSASVATSGPTSSATEDGSSPTRVADGVWAGEQAVLTVTPSGATAEFECAAGVLDMPLRLDPRGRFDVAGSYAASPGGPVSSDDPTPQATPARYHGRLIDSTHLDLTVVLSPSGQTQGPFLLELAGDASLERCL